MSVGKSQDESRAIIESLKKQLAQEKEKSSALEAQLMAIQETRGWKLLNKAYAIRFRLLPPHSPQDRIYRRLFRAGPAPETARTAPAKGSASASRLVPPGLHTEPIVVYQMGKVGSVTVQATLNQGYQSLGLEVPVYHVHALQNQEEREKDLLAKAKKGYPVAPALKSVREGLELKRRLAANPDECWNVITLVREPVGLSVSSFFQNLPQLIPDWGSLYDDGDLTLEELQRMFLDEWKRHHVPETWFDRELKPAFGVDVYSSPFPYAEGYMIYPPSRNGRVLLLRLEDLDRVAPKAFREFLGFDQFRMEKKNTAQGKEYYDLYRKFQKLPLPQDYVLKTYGTQYARHFYTPSEIEAFTRRWIAS